MRAGRLRHNVTIQQDTGSVRDASGHPTPSWTTLVQCPASVEPLSGQEFWTAQQMAAGVTHRVRIRYYPGITSQMRVLHRNRYLNIEAVRNLDERDIELELLCKEA